MRAKDEQTGTEISADFDLSFAAGSLCITVHSRGGSVAANNQTNPGYELLIQTILERLKLGDAILDDVRLASKTVASLPPSQRRIYLREFDLPLALSAVPDVTDVRLAIRRAVVTAHTRSKVATHGNATKRIEIVATSPLSVAAMASLLEWGHLDGLADSPIEESDRVPGYMEGARVLRTHVRRERNRTLVAAAKTAFKRKHGRLFCEACGFDFAAQYGKLGADFIEAHHDSPLAERDGESETRIEDLRMVCGNCHRILHRRISAGGMRLEDLKAVLSSKCASTTDP